MMIWLIQNNRHLISISATSFATYYRSRNDNEQHDVSHQWNCIWYQSNTPETHRYIDKYSVCFIDCCLLLVVRILAIVLYGYFSLTYGFDIPRCLIT